jgi:D-glycero-D-manno-heptose 1,7-bisphosphate phosphatase
VSNGGFKKAVKTADRLTGSALFLDRDGVINVDRGYVHRPVQFEFVPGIFPSAGRVNRFAAFQVLNCQSLTQRHR